MTREERCQLAIEKGYTYNQETGKIYGVRGNEIGSKDSDGYIRICITLKNKHIWLSSHHFAWYSIYKEVLPEGMHFDHINRIRDDNRIINLRIVTPLENSHNKNPSKVRANVRANVKGYYFNKSKNKYQVGIVLNKKYKFIGYFEKEIDAEIAYKKFINNNQAFSK